MASGNPVESNTRGRELFLLLGLAGMLLLILAALFNPLTVRLYLRWFTGPDRTAESLAAGSAAGLAACGLVLLGGAFVLRQTGLLDRLSRRRWAVNFFLAAVSLGGFVFAAEMLLRPFFRPEASGPPKTSIFMHDETLGWRLRPGSEDIWGGVPVTVNRDGFRGPPCPVGKAAGERRILFLGDSITFGYYLELEETVPRLVERQLASQAPPGTMVRAINAGVGGYSPWQELILLREQGLAWEPDVVVLGFVLNDVTEKFGLRRFGGSGDGFQLEHARPQDTIGGLLGGAAGLFRQTAIHAALSRLYAGIRLGSADLQAAATRMEELNVLHLESRPDDELVRRAWDLTLENVAAIAGLCRENGCRFLLVIYPYRFQLSGPAAGGVPQAVIHRFAGERGLDVLDLLPLFRREVRHGRRPDALFVDQSHPTAQGSRMAAGWIAEALVSRWWPPPGDPAPGIGDAE